ncbi:hypothetical protein NDI56_13135 [Haloarcula sp. S1CR25-12]|uniref:Uncharacterized protein n=1 Tax=Haloarcula saliterrae TaxID=2950534 RepID=A0ABU2FEW0_9EURY|nr:hypothetical protein [Haloarcula sp. S1CR25-12]MDS0260341.1 hypothetical protein [Haloarcula sp. S1CR25-12]
MKLCVRGTTYEGTAVDLRHRPVDGGAVAAAVRGERWLPAVDAPPAPLVYHYCGHARPGMGLRTKTALAAAARSRGHETAYDDEITALRERLAALDRSEPELPSARDPVDGERLAELRETVAAARGRLQAREAVGAETTAVEQAVREATRTLSERETERTAAEESRRQRRERARGYRDRRAEHRRLADRLANRRRDARRELVATVSDRFATALDALPGPTPSDPFDAPAVPAALAVLRLARTDAPVVLETDRFRSPAAAADRLGAPVVRC